MGSILIVLAAVLFLIDALSGAGAGRFSVSSIFMLMLTSFCCINVLLASGRVSRTPR
jgi:hypothetical protein